jgi:CopG antitoxin of type II toxin-antitoxin system
MKRKVRIPDTDSIEEMARFWDTHDATDFDDEFEEVIEPVFERKRSTVMVVPLEPKEVEAVEKIAKAKGLDKRVLLRQWVLERLREA